MARGAAGRPRGLKGSAAQQVYARTMVLNITHPYLHYWYWYLGARTTGTCTQALVLLLINALREFTKAIPPKTMFSRYVRGQLVYYRLLTGYLPATYRPFDGYLPATYRLLTGYLPAT